ncbi:hypothetical protein Vafri_17349 [Volvox africanus]|uniref:Uncharacterized protein n=1 Tax=Volvox africanus TaxID=51714 RepID=A0A8J4F6J6_9CHLO|nr:hypothetical protein Vafri_17349 [Volvox africanus]
MLDRVLVLYVLLGWFAHLPHLTIARDVSWWQRTDATKRVDTNKSDGYSDRDGAASHSTDTVNAEGSNSRSGSSDSKLYINISTSGNKANSNISSDFSNKTKGHYNTKKGPLFGGYDPYIWDDDWSNLDPQCPRANLTQLPRPCFTLHWICVHQETLVTHDWRYSYANPRRDPLPDMPWVENWNFPAAVGTNTDALRGRGARYRLHMRSASAHEPTAALRNPVFTNCTLPLIIVADFPYNMGEFFAKVLTALDQLSSTVLDEKVTLALNTPMGLDLAPFHSLLMMSYSRYTPITAVELGSRGCSDTQLSSTGRNCEPAADEDDDSDSSRGGCRVHRAVPWSVEAAQPHCFQRVIMCKWDLQTGGGTPLAAVARRVVSAFIREGMVPASPIEYPDSSSSSSSSSRKANSGSSKDKDWGKLYLDPDDPRGSSMLRVLIESRQGPVRNIKNLDALLDACKAMNRRGFTAGSFDQLACAATSFSQPDGSVDKNRFLTNVAAVRSAHVLVVLHGAGATNSWFMRQNSSALVELRPCQFGTRFAPWPDKYMPKQHEKNDDVIRFFALNIEDQAQCLKGDIETALRNHTYRRDSVGWDASYFARDQHLVLEPGPFLAFIRHVAGLLFDVQKYRGARDADRLHGYVVPEGLMYGPLSITNLSEYRAAFRPNIIGF